MRHWKYLSTSQAAHAMAIRPTRIPPYLEIQSASAFSTTIRMIASGMPVRMLREKYHQCGRRSKASVSPSWTRLSGYGIPRAYGRVRPGSRLPLRPAQLAEAVVAHAEVMAHLVQHGDAD